jgi:hypothetical protein
MPPDEEEVPQDRFGFGVEVPQWLLKAVAEKGAAAFGNVIAIYDAVSAWRKVKAEEAILYEKRTEVMERMSMALEHYNEKKFHSVL